MLNMFFIFIDAFICSNTLTRSGNAVESDFEVRVGRRRTIAIQKHVNANMNRFGWALDESTLHTSMHWLKYEEDLSRSLQVSNRRPGLKPLFCRHLQAGYMVLHSPCSRYFNQYLSHALYHFQN